MELVAEAFISFVLHLLATMRFTADIYDPQRLDPTQLGDLLNVPPSHNHNFFFPKAKNFGVDHLVCLRMNI